MDALIQFLSSGLTEGSRYALAALGFTLIYNASGAINFAQGEAIMLGGMVTAVLAAAGVGFTGTDGINLWMQVADERSAMLTLAAQGIGAAPGEPFMVRDDAPSLRVTVGNIHHSVMEYAARLADAAGNQPARSGQR